MDRVLLDSSVWIEYFRKGKSPISHLVDHFLDEDHVTLCGIIELEIIQGLRKHERQKIKDLFIAIPFIDSEREDFIEAGEELCRLRQKGITLPASDALIAAICIRRNLSLLTLDKDFSYFDKLKIIKIKE